MQKWLSVTLWKLQHTRLEDIMLTDGKSFVLFWVGLTFDLGLVSVEWVRLRLMQEWKQSKKI